MGTINSLPIQTIQGADLPVADLPVVGSETILVVQNGVIKLLPFVGLPVPPAPVLEVAAASYDVAAADAGKYVFFSNTSAKTVNVLADADEPLPNYFEISIRNAAASELTVVPAGGVSVASQYLGTLVVPAGGTITLKRVGADTFHLIGVTVPA